MKLITNTILYVKHVDEKELPMTATSIDLKIQLLHPDAVIPARANTNDAGLDLYSARRLDLYESNIVTYGTGIAVEIPGGYVGLLFPRSSIYKTRLRQCNAIGVIDAGYRGEIIVKYDLTDSVRHASIYNIGDRIAQLVITPIPTVNIKVVESLEESERGQGGFGSSGK